MAHFSFGRSLTFLAAILVCTASFGYRAQAAKGFQVSVHVSNNSNRCAWVTIYGGRVGVPWRIEGGQARPRFVHAGGEYTFNVPFTQLLPTPIPAEIKVRAEIMRSSACSGSRAENHDNWNKGIMPEAAFGHKVTVSSQITGPPYRVSKPRCTDSSSCG